MIPGSASPLLLKSAAAAGGYQVSRSLRFNSSDSGFCSRTPAVAGNRKTWTWAGWVKRSRLANPAEQSLFHADTGQIQRFVLHPDDKLYWVWGNGTIWRNTDAVYRDVSAWYHIMLVSDTDNATASNRLRFYVNGIEQSTSGTAVTPGQEWDINTTVPHVIGSAASGSLSFNGYLADIHFIDGQALTPSSFTEVSATTGQLIPKTYSGSYGTNGFQLKFADNSSNTAATLGKDSSGLGNNWTPNNLSVTAGAGNDSLVDSPTNYGTDTGVGGEVRGNYCTWNPLSKASSTTLSNGNLDMYEGSGVWQANIATIGVKSGKWYWEQTMTTNNYSYTGICNQKFLGNINTSFPGQTVNSWSYLTSSGIAKNDQGGGSEISVTLTTMASGGGTLGFALDLDNQKLWFSLNGTWMGTGSPNPATGVSAAFTNLTAVDTYFPCASNYGSSSTFNFGQRPFAYTAPSGFKALCTQNLPAPLVTKPNTVMDVVLYTGNGSTQTISGLAFSPDFVWYKSRVSAVFNHGLFDIVRGAQNFLASNSTAAELGSIAGVSAFNSDGFTLGSDAGGNTSTASMVAWAWDAGTSTVTNTAGSITSQVRANPTAGFSVVAFNSGSGAPTAYTVGHGLNVAPQFIITKSRTSASYNWSVYHTSIATTTNKYLSLNSTNATADNGTSIWGAAQPTSTVFGITSGNAVVANTDCIAYCFSPVVGYSAMGSYVGNGSSDGPFIFTGFRPKLLLIKSSTAVRDWALYDTSRSTYNTATARLIPNGSAAESASASIDILSNGFKIRSGSGSGFEEINESGATLIYVAWAENPFQYARAR